jgi:hypothetical protein
MRVSQKGKMPALRSKSDKPHRKRHLRMASQTGKAARRTSNNEFALRCNLIQLFSKKWLDFILLVSRNLLCQKFGLFDNIEN